MKIIILDFNEAKVKIINDIPENLQIEDIEDILVDKYNLKLSNIQFMVVPELEIQTLT